MKTTFINCKLVRGKAQIKFPKNESIKSWLNSRLMWVSKGNDKNAKIEIELEVEKGEKAANVFEAAKAFVEKRSS